MYVAAPCLQEVLELGDDASTDSGWGGTSSSSGEEKSSGQEQRQGSDEGDDNERSTSSGGGGGGSPGRRSVASCVVSGPELAVFLFQGGVNGSSRGGGSSDGGCSDVASEARKEINPSVAVRGEEEKDAAQLSPLLPSPKDDDVLFEYSGSGCGELSAKVGGDLRTGVLNGTVGHAITSRASGEMAGSDGEEPAAENEPHVSEYQEKRAMDSNGREDADAGKKSSFQSGALRGVDLAGSLLNIPTERTADDDRDGEHPPQQRRGEETRQGEGYRQTTLPQKRRPPK